MRTKEIAEQNNEFQEALGCRLKSGDYDPRSIAEEIESEINAGSFNSEPSFFLIVEGDNDESLLGSFFNAQVEIVPGKHSDQTGRDDSGGKKFCNH